MALVWSEETTGGGTWITLKDLNVLFDNKCCESEEDNNNKDDDNHKRHDQKQVDAELELADKRHNWDEYFGKAVDDDLKVVVAFKHGANTTS